MEVKGRIFQILEAISGQSARGAWKKQEFVIETMDQYPKKICFSVWNDKIALDTFNSNTVLNVHFNAESREYNGRWYTDLGAWKVDIEDASSIAADMPPPPVEVVQPEEDGLPF